MSKVQQDVKDFAFRTGSALAVTAISRAEYDSNWPDAVNHSVLKCLRRSPAHAKAAMERPSEEPSPAMKMGTALHCRVLTPTLYESSVVVAPKVDRRYKEGKEAWAAFEASVTPGVTVIDEDQSAIVTGMAQAIHAHPLAARLCSLLSGDPEVGLLWQDEATGVWCKGIADRVVDLGNGGTAIIDIKSTRNAGPAMFGRQAGDAGYHTQLAYYRRGVRAVRGKEAVCLIVAVENEAPHGVAVYDLSAEQIDAADRLLDSWLDQWARLQQVERWPAYPEEVTTLRLPAWSLVNEEVVDG